MDKKFALFIWIGCVLILYACGLQKKQLPVPLEKWFVTFAEGFTPSSDQENPEIASRVISAPDLGKIQASIQIDSLVVHPSRLRVKVGEVFSLQKLIITALDPNGKTVKHVPFALQYEKTEPSLIEPQQEKAYLIKGLRPGKMDLRIVSMISRPDGTFPEAFIKLYVQR